MKGTDGLPILAHGAVEQQESLFDGVYTRASATVRPVFRRLPPPTEADIAALRARVQRRVERLVVRRGRGSDAEAGSDLFASAVTASLQGSSEPSRLAHFDLGVGYRAVGLALTKIPTSVTNLESSGDRLSRLLTSASGNDSLRSATFNITTPSGHRQRAVSRTKPTPMP